MNQAMPASNPLDSPDSSHNFFSPQEVFTSSCPELPEQSSQPRQLPLIMAIINITHNSFSDGKRFFSITEHDRPSAEDASAHKEEKINYSQVIAAARQAIVDGATIIDLGGESTKPGAARITQEQEYHRVLPVVAELAGSYCVSIDTLRASIAQASIERGAAIINDVSGGLADPQMGAVIASHPQVRWILSHWAPLPKKSYRCRDLSIIREHCDDLITHAQRAGVQDHQIILDPGIGFAKNAEHNWEILSQIAQMNTWGYPVVIGASRKRFLASFGLDTGQRDIATAIVTAVIAQYRPWAVRVHNVPLNAMALTIAQNLLGEQM